MSLCSRAAMLGSAARHFDRGVYSLAMWMILRYFSAALPCKLA